MANLPMLSIKSATLPVANVAQQYVPPNWSDQPALYAITFRHPSTDTQRTSAANIPDNSVDTRSSFTYRLDVPNASAGYNAETDMNMFVFDAIRRAQHRRVATVTQHPLQTGFNIADHVVMQPSQLTLEVGMSDAIASYSVAGYTPMWAMNPSKSVSAYQMMETLMISRQLMTLNTRLETYDNMVLVDISVEDTRRTYFGGLAMVLTFQQVFIADISLSNLSARIQTAKETKQGTVQPQPPSQATIDQHKVPFVAPLSVPGTIPGAGFWSSAINAIVGAFN